MSRMHAAVVTLPDYNQLSLETIPRRRGLPGITFIHGSRSFVNFRHSPFSAYVESILTSDMMRLVYSIAFIAIYLVLQLRSWW